MVQIKAKGTNTTLAQRIVNCNAQTDSMSQRT